MVRASAADENDVRTRLRRSLLCSLLGLLAFSATAAARTNRGALRRLLVSDMSQPSQWLPAGVPTYFDWATHPRVRPVPKPSRYHAFTAWGQLYRCAGTRSAGSAAVQLKDMQAWVLLRGARRWRRIQNSSALHGDAFPASFSGPTLPARYVATRAMTTDRPVAGHNFHFWPQQGRVSLRAARVTAVTVSMQARLAPADPRGHRAPCLVLSAGADLWTSLNAPGGDDTNQDVGIGRFKRVQHGWRLFTMTTASARTLARAGAPALAAG